MGLQPRQQLLVPRLQPQDHPVTVWYRLLPLSLWLNTLTRGWDLPQPHSEQLADLG